MKDVPEPNGARFQDVVREARRQCEAHALTGAYPLADWRDISISAFDRLERELREESDEGWSHALQRVVADVHAAEIAWKERVGVAPDPSPAVLDILRAGRGKEATALYRLESGTAEGTAWVRVRQLARSLNLPWD